MTALAKNSTDKALVSDTQSIILVGVGGQGILLATAILSQAAQELGYDVKANEIHGMAQRGGSVIAQIRYGSKVFSPLIPRGTASILASLERVEGLRYCDYLAPDGWAIISDQMIIPVTASSGQTPYPELTREQISTVFPQLVFLNAVDKATELGSAKAANSIVLGALSTKLDFSIEAWEAAFHKIVKPKFVDLNMKAFFQGRQMVE